MGKQALPKPKDKSLMPGYNVFGDAMFFGEGMLKGEMLDSWVLPQTSHPKPSLPTPPT